MAQVRLRKDFYGAKIAKVSVDSIRVTIGFNYKGPAQTLDIETNTGKRGLWGDYDQESPTYHDAKPVYASDTFRSYTFSRDIPLSFWGARQIDDCAVEVVIRGEGVHADAVLWDAYTVNIAPTVGTFTVYPLNPPISYEEWCAEWEANGKYLTSWASAGSPVKVEGPYGADVPLVGKIAAHLWPGYGDAIRYGPSSEYSLRDGGVYSYDVGSNVLYER